VLGQRDARSLPFSPLVASSAWGGHAASFQTRRAKHIKGTVARGLSIDVSRVAPVDVGGWLDERNVSPAPVSAGGRLRAPSSTLRRAAPGVGELPPSKRKPITGHEAVYVRSAAADRHLGAGRIGLPGDAHDWNEEPNYAQSSVSRDVVGHRIAEERIGSVPSLSTEADEINARRQLAVAHYVRNGGV